MPARKILVVHNVSDLRDARASSLNHIFSFQRYAPDNYYLYQNFMLPVTDAIRTTDWDAVIFDSTSLGTVTLRPRYRFPRLCEGWAFLRDHTAHKIAMPQDDASHGALLDQFFNWLKIDTVLTVRPEFAELIYPRTKKHAAFISTCSGYVDDLSLERMQRFSKRFGARRYVVGQRSTMYPIWGGRFSRRKGLVAKEMALECARRGVTANISTDPKDTFNGDAWFEFLGDTQFVVGAEGGHSLWDPYGTIQDDVNDYLARFPNASFDEVEYFCFDGLDQNHIFAGFAPRALEAAVMGCGQVLVEGGYRGFIDKWRHYIPLKPDFSNFDEVFQAMSNQELVFDMIEATRRDLVESPKFRYSNFVSRVMGIIGQSPKARVGRGKKTDWSKTLAQHSVELVSMTTLQGMHVEKLAGEALMEWVIKTTTGQLLSAAELGLVPHEG